MTRKLKPLFTKFEKSIQRRLAEQDQRICEISDEVFLTATPGLREDRALAISVPCTPLVFYGEEFMVKNFMVKFMVKLMIYC